MPPGPGPARTYGVDLLRDVEFYYDANEGGETGYLSVDCPEMGLTIEILPAELASLAGIRDTNWAERRVIRAGTCDGLSAFWCMSESPGLSDTAALVRVGLDAEGALISVLITESALTRLIALAGSVSR